MRGGHIRQGLRQRFQRYRLALCRGKPKIHVNPKLFCGIRFYLRVLGREPASQTERRAVSYPSPLFLPALHIFFFVAKMEDVRGPGKTRAARSGGAAPGLDKRKRSQKSGRFPPKRALGTHHDRASGKKRHTGYFDPFPTE